MSPSLSPPIILELLVKSLEKLLKRFPRLILFDFDLPTEPCGSENDGQLMLHLWTRVRIPGGQTLAKYDFFDGEPHPQGAFGQIYRTDLPALGDEPGADPSTYTNYL